MITLFRVAALVAIVSTAMVVTRRDAVHALLYLVVSLLSVALVFFALGAPFIAALEVIVYAGAIMVLFLFVVMMLNLGRWTTGQEALWLPRRAWAGPALLSLLLLVELAWVLARGGPAPAAAAVPPTVGPKQVGIVLYGPYLVGVELASMLLLSGLAGAFHLGRRAPAPER